MWCSLIADTGGGGGKTIMVKGLAYLRNIFVKPNIQHHPFHQNVSIQVNKNVVNFSNIWFSWYKGFTKGENHFGNLVTNMVRLHSPHQVKIYRKPLVGKLTSLVLSYGFVGVAFNGSEENLNLLGNGDKILSNKDLSVASLNATDDISSDNTSVDFPSTDSSSDFEVIESPVVNEIVVEPSDFDRTVALISKLNDDDKCKLIEMLLSNFDKNDSETYAAQQSVIDMGRMCRKQFLDLRRIQLMVQSQQRVIQRLTNRLHYDVIGPTASELDVISYEMVLKETDDERSSFIEPIFIN